jgi:hypothetical protein
VSDAPVVPILKPAPAQAMGLASAFRQAAIDMGHLPPGHHVMGWAEQDVGGGVAYVIKAQHVSGMIAFSQRYDGTGRRLDVLVSITK